MASRKPMRILIFQLEEQPAAAASKAPPRLSEFRAKFEKFEKGPEPKKPAATGARAKSPTSAPLERDKVLDEANKLTKDLQKQIDDLQKTRDKEREELLAKAQKVEKDSEKEKKDLKARISMVGGV